jgi:hypothetical protein
MGTTIAGGMNTGDDNRLGSDYRSGVAGVEDGAREGRLGGLDFDETHFREDYRDRYASAGGRYEDYDPAYRYGWGMRDRYRGREWNDIESDVRTDWERDRPGTWDRFKDAIRGSWERTKRALS